jgi:hypothetical protein
MLGMTGNQVFKLLEDLGGCLFILALALIISMTW